MTRKRIVFVSALAAGATLGEATAAAGYTLDYAMHLCGQEAVQDAVSRRKAIWIRLMRGRGLRPLLRPYRATRK